MKIKVKICDIEIEMLVDIGIIINIFDELSYSKLRNCLVVNFIIIKVFVYGVEKLVNLVGSIYINILLFSRWMFVMIEVYIVRGNCGFLFSY